MLESDIFYILQKSRNIFNEFFENRLSAQKIFDDDQTTDQFLIDKFQK